ncbi:MAG: nucleotidyltransferase domain-containing protein [Proteobacteria bacterium]|nr:nucleotidyltransferase domain-containing protein [Pseudomonadota bacterium]
MINLPQLKPEIEQVCRALPVKRLGLFGSVLTQDFAADSDVDVLQAAGKSKSSIQ